ncbi:hypothetical protein ACQE3E_06695 [Methylomonas sp. MED-D]|uniref:hypothetical protein n=1 Tax=Methylomonas sp. MED-D TaxID=3418768 RepID=UPI003D04FB47
MQGVTIDFTANMVKLQGQIDKSLEKLDSFRARAETVSARVEKSLSAVGVGLSVTGLAAFVKSGIDAVDALNDLSDRTNIAIKDLAGFSYAAKLGDTDVESMAKSINKLSVNIGKNGEDFKKLGIDSKDPLENFLKLSDVYRAIEDPQTKAAFGAAALGKAYAEMAPLLERGSADLRQLIDVGRSMSGVTEEQAKAAGEFNDKLDELSNRSLGFRSAFAIGVLEPLVAIGEAIDADIKKSGVLIGTLAGIADGYKNFALSGTGGGLSKELDDINRKIAEQKELLSNVRRGDVYGGAAREIAEQKQLNQLIEQRGQIERSLSEQRRSSSQESNDTKVSLENVQYIIDKNNELETARKKAAKAAELAAKKEVERAAEIAKTIENLQFEIVISGELESQQRRLMEWHSLSAKATQNESEHIAELVWKKHDLIEANQRQMASWNQLVSDANAYFDLSKSVDNFSRLNSISLDQFNSIIEKIREVGRETDLSEKQVSYLLDKAGRAYNEVGENGKTAFDTIDQYAVRAAGNMESAFADFVVDADGSFGDLESSFLKTVARMLAEAGSAQLLETLLGKTGANGKIDYSSGLIGTGFTALASFFHDGGIVGAGGRAMAVNPAVFAGAPRLHGGAYIKPDEVPAILQKGELVLSRRQVAGMAGGGSGGDIQINTSVTVTNSGSNMDAARGQALGNAIEAKFRELIVDEKRPGGLLA